MMGRIILSSFGATSRRAAAAGQGIFSSASITMLLTSVLLLATSSCGGAGSSIVGSTLQDVQSLQAAAGDNQVGTAGADLPTPITVRALTKGGQGVSGISVLWTFSGGAGSLTPDGSVSQSLTTVTDKQGKSSVYWQLDTIAGDQTATATLSGTSSNSTTSVKFHSHGKAGGPARLVVSPGTDTLAVGGSAQFTATVLDRWKNVISGATVSWSSSNDSVLTVSSTGMATALRSGSATVIATTSATSTSAAGSSSISGGASVSVESSTASATSPPGTVSDLKASNATDSSVTLTWTQVNDGTGNPAKYALRYGTPTMSWSAAYGTEVSVNGTSIGATESYTFKGLQAGTTYQFQLVSYRGTLNVDAVFGGLSNVVSGSTTGTGTPTVTVTPASLSFTSLNATAQLSAVAKDSTGNTVTNPGFTWKSLATSIATVSTAGLVTAKAVGATAIVVTAACCGSDTTAVTVDTLTSSTQVVPYFQDGFETGNLSHTQNGFRWTGTNHKAGDSVFVTNKFAHTGTYSLEFHYAGRPDLQDGWAEQRFDLAADTASAPRELWLDFYWRIPANFALRSQSDGATNDKLLAFWATTYGYSSQEAGGDLEYQLGGGGVIVPHLNLDGSSTDGGYSPDNDLKHSPSVLNLPFFNPAVVAGTWVHVQVQIRQGNGSTDLGAYKAWINGQLKFSLKNWDIYATTYNFFMHGYLMGWANSGFTNDTNFYIDDFKVYVGSARPSGWPAG